jgi:Na+/H+-dicarboxylate symporter
MRKLPLHWKIVIAMILGVVWALISGQLGWNKFTNDWINPFGVIFINLLKFIAVPLVLFSIITGVASFGDPRKLGKLGAKTLLLYLGTTVLAVSIGLTLVNIIKPGVVSNVGKSIENRLTYEVWALDEGHKIKDNKDFIAKADSVTLSKIQLKNNLEKASNEYKDLSEKKTRASSTQGPLQPLVDVVPSNIINALGDGNLMLQVIFFALFFGISISFLPNSKTATLRNFFNEINDVFIYMVNIIMIAAPFFVFCLMAGVLVKMADSPKEMMDIFANLGMYSLTVVLGLAILLFGVYPFLMRIFKARITYKGFFAGLSPAQFLAFSTSSSAATLPVTLHCVENNLKVPKVVADFVLPIGATVNMKRKAIFNQSAFIF